MSLPILSNFFVHHKQIFQYCINYWELSSGRPVSTQYHEHTEIALTSTQAPKFNYSLRTSGPNSKIWIICFSLYGISITY